MPRLSQILSALFARAPRELASEGDNIGLQVGNPSRDVRRALVALDPGAESIRLAVQKKAQLLLVHHPLIFHPLKSIDADSYISGLVIEAIRKDLAIVTMHTNLDYAAGGVNDRLAQAVDLREVRPLIPIKMNNLVKLVVFVPPDSRENVRKAMCDSGAGVTGDYRDCSFRAPGTGTFMPLPGAEPFIGEIGQFEEVSEERLELLVDKSRLSAVLSAMRAAHPYEEIAYDIYPLDNYPAGAGQGRVGRLPNDVSLGSFATRIKRVLRAEHMRVTGDPARVVGRVVVSSGSARDWVAKANSAGAQVLLGGEVPHNDRLEAADTGLAVIEAGHGPTERPAVWVLADWLQADFKSRLEVIRHDAGEVVT